MDLVLQFFGDSREKTPSPPLPARPPFHPFRSRRTDTVPLFHPALFPLRRSAKGTRARGGAGARGCPSARPTWPCRARRCPLGAAPSRRGPGPAPRLHRTPRLGGVSDSAGSAADPYFRAYKSASSSPILLSSPSPGSPCNHSKMPGVERKPQSTIHPSKRRRSAASK